MYTDISPASEYNAWRFEERAGHEEEREHKATGNNFEKVRFPRLNVKVLNVTRARSARPLPSPALLSHKGVKPNLPSA